MITKHPDTSFLMEYTSGSLALAPLISVTTHLKFCDKCRSEVSALTNVGGEILSAAEAVPVSDELLDKILDCVEENEEKSTAPASSRSNAAEVQDLPDYVRELLPADLRWRFLSPSLKVAPITVGETTHELALHRIKAGGKAPTHTHRGREVTVVLKGSFSDEDGVYQEGDFIVREPGDVHRPHAAQHEECICLSVLEAPIKLTGLKRVFNPFISFSPS